MLYYYWGGTDAFVNIPDEIKNKKACVNIKSRNSHCFAWAVASYIQNVTKCYKTSYRHFSEFLELKEIEF